MSAVYKRLGREDSFITPYTAHKTFTIVSSSFSDSGIKVRKAVSGSFPYTDESLLYAGIDQIMFESELRYTSEHSQDRTLSTKAVVLEIPKELYGEAIEPGSITLTTTAVQPNQFDFDVYDRDGVLIESSSGNEIGYVNYTLGLCVFTSGGYATTNFDPHQEAVTTQYSAPALAIDFLEADLISPDWDPVANRVTVSDTTLVIADVIDWNTVNADLHPVLEFTLVDTTTITREVANINDNGDGTLLIEYLGDRVVPTEIDRTSIQYYATEEATSTSYLVRRTGTWPSDITDYIDTTVNGSPVQIVSRVNDYVIDVSPTTFLEDPNNILSFEGVEVTYNTTQPNYTASFNSSVDIHTYNFHCVLEPNELSYTHNPTVLSDDSGSLLSFATGSDFRTYATTIGIYNSANELLAVGKLGQPTPILPDTPYTFVVQIDL